MSRFTKIAVVMAVAAALAIALAGRGTPVASAHPLGNFTISRYAALHVSAQAVSVRYVVDMAEIPAFQERGSIDTNGDGAVDDGERAAYASSKARELAQSLDVQVNEEPAHLRLVASEVWFPPGQAGLSLLRLTATFSAPLPDGWRDSPRQVRFADRYYGDRLGWREIVVRAGDGVDVRDPSVPAHSATAELTQYPNDALSSTLDVRSASFSFVPSDPGGASGGTREPQSASVLNHATVRAVNGNTDSPSMRFGALIAKDRLSAGVIVIALLAAMGFGALHALSPGHGKTVVAAYLVGSRGTMRHALLLGVTVTLTHTASVYALGFATLYLSAIIVPERLYPWLGIASGALIVLMGLSLLYGRLRSSGLVGDALRWLRHLAVVPVQPPRLAMTAGASGAVLLAMHGRARREENGGRTDHGLKIRDDEHQGEGEHPHRHGFGQAHSHTIPGQDGDPVTWRQLIGLGIFGGMLPCPSAIVVMLSAISLHRVGFGLILIVAFSLGLAGVLTGIGFSLVVARRLSSRVPLFEIVARRTTQSGGVAGLAVRVFPPASAAAVIAAGAIILLRALAQQGVV